MQCKECGTNNAATMQFCVRCRQPIAGSAPGGAAGVVRTTEAEGGLFDPKPGPVPMAPRPLSTPAPAASGARRTVLEEGGGGPPPAPVRVSQQLPASPAAPAWQAGAASVARNRTVLVEGPPATVPVGQAAAAPKAAVGTARIVGWMVSFDKNPAGQEYVIRAGRSRIGRGRDNEISLFFEDKASDLHATIIWRNGNCAVKDEGSTNGTLVNGDDIGIASVPPLQSGDSVTIGGSTFLVFLIESTRGKALWSSWG